MACFALLLVGILVTTSLRAVVGMMGLLLGDEFLQECAGFYHFFPGASWLLACWCILWLPLVALLSSGCPLVQQWHAQLTLSAIFALNASLIPMSTAILVPAQRLQTDTPQPVSEVFPTLLGSSGPMDVKDGTLTCGRSIFSFGAAHASEGYGPCVICLQDYAVGDELLELHCGHVHHKDCICRWLRSGASSCPMRCLTDVGPAPNPGAAGSAREPAGHFAQADPQQAQVDMGQVHGWNI